MEFLKKKLAAMPQGTGALFFIQTFATLGFAVLYSTLVLYATKHLHLSAKDATALMGVFGAFNYGLHLFGGYLGGRFLSNRNLFVGGMVLQMFGCGSMAIGTPTLFYWGLALFLTGSGLNVTCLNMMLTQRFAPEDPRREGAFLWNYAGMNIGFFVGFSVAGYFQATESYSELFMFATLGNFLAIVLAALTWKSIRDLNTPLLLATPSQFRMRLLVGLAILVGATPAYTSFGAPCTQWSEHGRRRHRHELSPALSRPAPGAVGARSRSHHLDPAGDRREGPHARRDRRRRCRSDDG